MQDLNDLYYLVQVVDHGGFSPAGRAIGIPKSRLSRRIAALEKRLGVQLLYRSTRQLSLTDIGRHYYTHCAAMLAEAQTAEEIVAHVLAEPRGRIRISCPPALMHFSVAAILTRFMQQYPAIEVEVDVTGRRVDPVREGLDLALRVRFPPLEDSDLALRVLSRSPQALLAAPPLQAGHTPLASPEELSRMPSIDWNRSGNHHIWCLDGPNGESCEVPHRPRLVTDDLTSLYQAALMGLGVVQLPLLLARQALQEGRLVAALPGWQPRGGLVHAVFPQRRCLLPSVRRLLDFLADHFSDEDVDSILTADNI